MSIERNKNLLVIPVNGSPVAKVVMVEGGVGESLIVRNIWVQGLELYTSHRAMQSQQQGSPSQAPRASQANPHHA